MSVVHLLFVSLVLATVSSSPTFSFPNPVNDKTQCHVENVENEEGSILLFLDSFLCSKAHMFVTLIIF